MIHCIIFSKNRAAQLDLLIRSIHKFAPTLYENIFVIYSAHDDHKQAYDIVNNKYQHIGFLHEQQIQGFEQITKDTLNHIQTKKIPLISFLVDDDIFIRKVNITPQEIHEIIYHTSRVFSLRLGRQFKYLRDFFLHKNYMTIPCKTNVKCAAYPLSIDGNIFDTKFITKLIDKISFVNPNKLESKLQKFTPLCSNIYSTVNQCLVGAPINRVSDSSRCSYGERYGINEDDICQQFLKGKIFDLDNIDPSQVNNTHFELQLKMS